MSIKLTLKNQDCLLALADMPDASVSAIISDPPYEISFMSRGWDATGIAYSPVLWANAYRVLVPGGIVKAFSATRTFHRMAAAMQNAGFTKINIEAWTYGSGFPKSMNIGKAIDKHGGQSLGWFIDYVRVVCEERNIPTREITALFPSRSGNMTGWFWNKASGAQSLTIEQFNTIKNFLGLPFADLAEAERAIVGYKEAGIGSGKNHAFTGANHTAPKVVTITAPTTDAAKVWDGWGTALKPSWEPVLIGKKQ
jgi:hypothetical protein